MTRKQNAQTSVGMEYGWPAHGAKKKQRESIKTQPLRTGLLPSSGCCCCEAASAASRSSASMRCRGRPVPGRVSSVLDDSVDPKASSVGSRMSRAPCPSRSKFTNSRTSLMVKAAWTCPRRPTTDTWATPSPSTERASDAASVLANCVPPLARTRAQSSATLPCPITTTDASRMDDDDDDDDEDVVAPPLSVEPPSSARDT